MSGFFKTVSSLRQNFFACLPAIRPLRCLKRQGGAPSRRVGAESPEAWLPAATIGGHRHYPLGGGEGHREWPFAQWKCLFSLQVSLGQKCPAFLAAESQPVRHQQGGWLGCVLTDCLWLIEGKILGIFWEKCQGASVDIHTIFKNQDIYIPQGRKPQLFLNNSFWPSCT